MGIKLNPLTGKFDLVGSGGSSTDYAYPALFVAASNAPDRSKDHADYTCDGTDDNVQIQQALDALPSGGGTVVLSEGLFTIGSASIILDNYQHLMGQGHGTILKAKNSFNKDMITSTGSQANRHMIIENMKIDGNRANNTSGRGIYLFGARNSTIRECWITETDEEAVYLAGDGTYLGWFNQIDRCEMDLCDAGIRCTYSEHNWITHNTLSFIDGKGIFCESDLDYIINNQLDFCSGYTIHLYFGAGLWNVFDNSIDRPQDHGIVIEGADKSNVCDNYFDTTPANKAAIVNAGSDYCTIARNKVTQNVNSGSIGISETSATDRCMYVDNTLTGVATAISVNASTTNLIRHRNQGDNPVMPGGSSEYVIAASDAPAIVKQRADLVCDGTADDTDISTALDTYDSIRLTEGNFNLAASISVPEGSKKITGSGWETILNINNSVNDYAIKFEPAAFTYCNGAVIRDLKINCNGTNQSGGGGIYGKGAVWCLFDHLWITVPYNNGMYLLDDNLGSFGHHNSVINCLFDEGENVSGGDGRALLLDQSDENYIAYNTFQDNGRSGASEPNHIYEKAGLNQIISNSFVGGAMGLKLQGRHNTVIGNKFDGCRNHNMKVNGAKNIIIGNYIYNLGAGSSANTIDGINIDNTSENIIQGNMFHVYNGVNGSRYGINFDFGASDNQVSGNVFTTIDTGTYGTGKYNSSENMVVAVDDNYVINDLGSSIDIQMKGATDSNLLYLDTSADKVGVGTASPNEKLEINGKLRLAATSGSQPYKIYSANLSSDDRLIFLDTTGGDSRYWFDSSAGTSGVSIAEGGSERAYFGTEGGDFMFESKSTYGIKFRTDGGSERMKIFASSGNVVINDSGNDSDFRIEGDTATQLFVTDGGLDAVQIGTTTAGNIADFRSGNITFNNTQQEWDFIVAGASYTDQFKVDGTESETIAKGILISRNDNSGQVLSFFTFNNTNDANADSGMYFAYNAAGVVRYWGIGVDNTADHFSIGTSNTLGDNDRLIISQAKALTDTAVSLFEVALTAGSRAGGVIMATIEAADSTDHQAFTQFITWAVVNKAGAYTKTVTIDTANDAKAVSAGTLTAAWAFADGTNKVTMQVTPAGSLTETTYNIRYTLFNNSSRAITVL